MECKNPTKFAVTDCCNRETSRLQTVVVLATLWIVPQVWGSRTRMQHQQIGPARTQHPATPVRMFLKGARAASSREKVRSQRRQHGEGEGEGGEEEEEGRERGADRARCTFEPASAQPRSVPDMA
eukprot:2030733-Rhodomonas_salina.2